MVLAHTPSHQGCFCVFVSTVHSRQPGTEMFPDQLVLHAPCPELSNLEVGTEKAIVTKDNLESVTSDVLRLFGKLSICGV